MACGHHTRQHGYKTFPWSQEVLSDCTAEIWRVVQQWSCGLPLFSQNLVIAYWFKKNSIKTNFVGVGVIFLSLNFYVNFLEPKSSSSGMTSTLSQPLRTTPGNKPSGLTRDHSAGTPRSSGEPQTVISVEAFSGLRLRSVTVKASHSVLLPH